MYSLTKAWQARTRIQMIRLEEESYYGHERRSISMVRNQTVGEFANMCSPQITDRLRNYRGLVRDGTDICSPQLAVVWPLNVDRS